MKKTHVNETATVFFSFWKMTLIFVNIQTIIIRVPIKLFTHIKLLVCFFSLFSSFWCVIVDVSLEKIEILKWLIYFSDLCIEQIADRWVLDSQMVQCIVIPEGYVIYNFTSIISHCSLYIVHVCLMHQMHGSRCHDRDKVHFFQKSL